MVAKTIITRKTNETVEEELLNSIRESNTVENPGLKTGNVTRPEEKFAIINGYEEITKTQNKGIYCETGTDAEEVQRYRRFIIKMRLRRSSIYFKIGV